MFAKYSSEKFPMAFIYQVLKFEKNIRIASDFSENTTKKVSPILKAELDFSKPESSYNYFLIFENLRKKSKKEFNNNIQKNKFTKKIYSIKSVLGLSNDLIV
ncbi:MAG: hypothetical protein CFH01_01837 [Alphaproteobacteria bacterium MarineAlpha2_Bin1]|nr:MAG: hypothetical protein CFH01_01837 [Alphaproteobacteria bacterium MarineAlpha2_Bin1]